MGYIKMLCNPKIRMTEEYARNRKNYVEQVRKSFDDSQGFEKDYDFVTKEDGTKKAAMKNVSFFKIRLLFSVLLFFAYLYMEQTGNSFYGVSSAKLYETVEENYDYTNLKKYVMILTDS